ncbi:MAG: oligosaccharide flippase family protein [Bacteroidales bacterium]|nr:oligosaccharide flippase family protein [Bacteroidales bacterium]
MGEIRDKVVEMVRGLVRTKVLENYSMMTLLSVANIVIGFLIYPFVIRALGTSTYGCYVAAFSASLYLQSVIAFGFNDPCTKYVVENIDDRRYLSGLVGNVLALRSLFLVVGLGVVYIVSQYVAVLADNWMLFVMCALQNYGMTVFPSWYFQGVKRMKVVTVLNVSVRLVSVPLVICLVRTPGDLMTYAYIAAGTPILATLGAYLWLTIREGIVPVPTTIRDMTGLVRVSVPFFLTHVVGDLKNSTIYLLVAQYFGTGSLAYLDLANKIVNIPRELVAKINIALFPEFVTRATASVVRKIMRSETYIALVVIALIALSGYPAVLILGGEEMTPAYPLLLILSLSIYSTLIVECYLKFVFIPTSNNYLITLNQVVAFVSAVVLLGILSMFYTSEAVAPVVLTLSSYCELLYCCWVTRRRRLLQE